MGIFGFLSKDHDKEVEPVNEAVNESVDLRNRDSMSQSLRDALATKAAILGAIENILGGNEIVKLKVEDRLNLFSSILLNVKVAGVEPISDSSKTYKIKYFYPLHDVDQMMEVITNDKLPCIVRIRIPETNIFPTLSDKEFEQLPSNYAFLVSGYLLSEEAFILKTAKGQAFGDNGYIYINKEDMKKYFVQGYFIDGIIKS